MPLMNVDTGDLQNLRRQLHDARTDIHKALDAESRRFAPMLVRSAQSHARGEVEKRIAQSGSAKMTRDGFTVRFGATGKVSGAPLREITGAYEFGSPQRERFSKPYRSRHRTSGKAMRVSRRTRRQLPPQDKTGRFLHPALAEVAPQLVSAYVKAIVRTVTGA